MGKIELRVDSVSGVAVEHHWFAVFGLAGGTVGRGGQNKLVLTDSDARVARVHAMVRLESDAAYIANVCERRPMRVAEQELLAGQEVQLNLGAVVQIGPYSLRAVAPGTPMQYVSSPASIQAPHENVVTAPLPTAPSVQVEPEVVATAARKPAIGLSATPNPWADIPQQSRGEFSNLLMTPEPPTVQAAQEWCTPQQPETDNPFAMLGRAQVAPIQVVPPPTEPAEPLVAMANPWHADDASRHVEAKATELPNALGHVLPGRPLLIPEDYDLFAPDVRKQEQAKDPWGGGLIAQSLTDVANVRNDGLLRSLPTSGPVNEPMDNPAHSGLPKALEPRVELDPMRLFQSPGAVDLNPTQHAPASRGPELAQVFSLPRSAAAAQPREAVAAAPATVAVPASGKVTEPALVSKLGLKATQGLDLGMFDATGGAPLDWEPVSAERVQPPDLPAQSIATPTPIPIPTPVTTSHSSVGWDVQPSNSALDLDLTPPPLAVTHLPQDTPGSTRAVGAHELINAFLDGSGLAPGRVQADITPEFMRTFGEAFRVAVQGTMDLLAARSEIKREFRADVTIIAPRANNPLKFLPNADGVIMQLVGQTFPGFMKPVPSMKEAYFDLQVHQLALMAGIRAAYSEALARFDPVELEKRSTAEPGLLKRFSPHARKAALWDEYKSSFSAMRRHAEDDLQAFSGQTFVAAYEAAAEAARVRP